jgi:hypothetical protein
MMRRGRYVVVVVKAVALELVVVPERLRRPEEDVVIDGARQVLDLDAWQRWIV